MVEDSNEKQSVQSKIESAVSKIAGAGSGEDLNRQGTSASTWQNYITSFFNGLGVGLLLGLLLGLAVSPVVSAIIGTLSSLLVVLLGLNENYLNPVKSIRIGSFGLFCVLGILSGIYIRSHNSLAPSLKSLYQEYKTMGFSDKDARDFIAYQEFDLVPEEWAKADSDLPAVTGDVEKAISGKSGHLQLGSSENITAKKRKSVLYSSEVDASQCYILESSNEKMSFRDIKMNFIVAGGTWKELATDLDPALPENIRISALLMLRDIFCASSGSGIIKVKCENLQDINENTPIEAIRKKLTSSGEIWSRIVENTNKKIEAAYQKPLYLSLIKILCHD